MMSWLLRLVTGTDIGKGPDKKRKDYFESEGALA